MRSVASAVSREAFVSFWRVKCRLEGAVGNGVTNSTSQSSLLQAFKHVLERVFMSDMLTEKPKGIFNKLRISGDDPRQMTFRGVQEAKLSKCRTTPQRIPE
jgi:hypothetical protein